MNKQSLTLLKETSLQIKITSFMILFLLFIAPICMISLIRMFPANDQPGYDSNRRASIYKERDLTQHFISKKENLTAIATSIRNPNLMNRKEISFVLYDENNNMIRTSSLNGFNIGDGDFMKFVFEPIVDSKDKKYSFTISSPSSFETETVELFLIDPTDEVLEYTYDNETRKGGIPMVTFHKPESKLQNIKLVYSNLFSKLLLLGSQK